jgi:restriction system protein
VTFQEAAKGAAALVGGLVGGLVLISFVPEYHDALFPLVQSMAGFSAFAALIVVVGVLIQREAKQAKERQERYERDIFGFMSLHQRALARKRWQLVQHDDYGKTVTKKWDKEKRDFISAVLVPYLIDLGHFRAPVPTDRRGQNTAHQQFDALVEQWAQSAPNRADIADITTGQEYERLCAERLVENGWKASLTKASGDQGADIIGSDNGLRVVFQCKFYTSPVGNKAVQEVAAARLHEQAALAVVISNAMYTQSAKALAKTTGTILIHHDDIPLLREIIKRGRLY